MNGMRRFIWRCLLRRRYLPDCRMVRLGRATVWWWAGCPFRAWYRPAVRVEQDWHTGRVRRVGVRLGTIDAVWSGR
jgi:hypothetical protein